MQQRIQKASGRCPRGIKGLSIFEAEAPPGGSLILIWNSQPGILVALVLIPIRYPVLYAGGD